jgi:hypothetical protein
MQTEKWYCDYKNSFRKLLPVSIISVFSTVQESIRKEENTVTRARNFI